MIYMFNNNLGFMNEVSKDEIIEAVEDSKLNDVITATIKYNYKSHNENYEYFGYKQDEKFYLYKIVSQKKENNFIELEGLYVLFDDLKGRILRDKRPKNKTTQEVMNIIFDNTGWEVFSNSNRVSSDNYYYISRLEAFKNALKKWRVEFEPLITLEGNTIRKRLYIKNQISKDYGKWYEYGDKLISVVSERNDADLYNVWIGRGKGIETENGGYTRKINFSNVVWSKSKGDPINKAKGDDFIVLEGFEGYRYPNGYDRVNIVEFNDIEDPEELLTETYNYAIKQSRPKVQLKATATDKNKIELGEVVTIIRDDLNIRYKTRVFRVVKNLLSENLQTFEFGDEVVKTTSSSIKQIAQKSVAEIKEAKVLFDDLLKKSIDNITKVYFGENGYNYTLDVENEYNMPAGFYSFNKPIDDNPTKVIYMGAGKLLIANSKDVNNQWEWKTALTGDGIIADEITSGVLKGGNVYFDLTNGILNIGDELTYSPTDGLVISGLSEIKEDIIENTDLLSGKIEDLDRYKDYIRIKNGTLELGSRLNDLRLILTNEKISFNAKGKEIAYMSGDLLKIVKGEFTESLILGKFGFFPRSNGNLSFLKY